MSPIQDMDTGGNINLPGLSNWLGVLAWKRGALLVSFVWVAMLVMVIDRRWFMAGVWAVIGAAFALFGIIHVPEAGFDNFDQPVWEQCESSDSCWEYAEQWMFFLSYIMLGVTFGLIGLARQYGSDSTLLHQVVDDETEQGFKDWFADAAVDTSRSHFNQLGEQEAELAVGKDPDITNKTAKNEEPSEDIEGPEIEA